MDFQEAWEKALRGTEIIRSRVKGLSFSANTKVPYILLTVSKVNEGDTVVRKGEILVQKPKIILPPHSPQFEGFEFDKADNFKEKSLLNLLFVRGVVLPSFHYNNKMYSMDIHQGGIKEAADYHNDLLQKKEDTCIGLVKGVEETWPFSLLVFVCSQVAKNAESDIRRLLDDQ